MLAPWLEWPLLVLYLIGAFRLEWMLLPRILAKFGAESLKPAAIGCIFWFLIAAIFNILVYLVSSSETGEAWTSGYVLELTLSIDNLFIFAMLFRMFETPADQVDRALLFGIGAAAALRLVFFVIGSSLFEWVSWIRIPFGLLLLWTAYKTVKAAGSESKLSLEHSPVLEWVEHNLPFTPRYDKAGKFFQRDNSGDLLGPQPNYTATGRLVMTMLGAVVVTLAVVDVLFALDAVAAKVTQTQDLYVNFTSSLFAMAALRSLYFVIAELTVTFKLLKYGVALVLAYVAVELILSMWIHIPNGVSCLIILVICGSSIVASVFASMATAKPVEATEMSLAASFGLEEKSPIMQAALTPEF